MMHIFMLSASLSLAIDFDQSHLFFPRIISITLCVLLGLIIIKERRVLVGLARKCFSGELRPDSYQSKRLAMVVSLIAAYFWLMGLLGDWYPNMGLGFLIASIPFIGLFSLLYVPELTKKILVVITANAVLAPFIVWYVLGQLMNVSLP